MHVDEAAFRTMSENLIQLQQPKELLATVLTEFSNYVLFSINNKM